MTADVKAEAMRPALLAVITGSSRRPGALTARDILRTGTILTSDVGTILV
jgi:hypothetical protein